MGGMKGPWTRFALILIMPLLIAPLAALTWLASRSVDQQELAMRSRLRDNLLLEIGQTNGRIRAWFDELPAFLGSSAPGAESRARPTASELAAWKGRDRLVGIPFLLNAEGAIVHPDSKRAETQDEDTRRFFWRYLNVFASAEPIPVYRNIADEYESSIVKGVADAPALAEAPAPAEAPASAQKTASAESTAESSASPAVGQTFSEGPAQADVPAPAEAPTSFEAHSESVLDAIREAPPASAPRRAPMAQERSSVRSKVAQSLFETDVEVQRQVYDLAAEEGKETLKRNVNPKIDAVVSREADRPRSVILETSRYFKDLVSQGERGIVPRIFDNAFVLIYWERRGEWIVGCELDMDAVRETIAGLAGNPSDGVRNLAVLDQAGTPVVPVPGVETVAWRTPLVSGEISEFLPYWETAVLLADASAFESRVRASRYALTALVLALALSVSIGAVFLWRYSSSQLMEARRRTGFVTTVSHELKTPLTSIRMYSEMLAEGADDEPGKRKRYLERIVGESERLTRLINDVLDVAKLERGNRALNASTIDVAAVARETFDRMFDRLSSAGFTARFECLTDQSSLMADREAVIRILLNLLSNAEKYSDGTREITMTVTREVDSGNVNVSVSDRGIGVPRSHRARIFREFHRVDSSLTSGRGGTGLGLSIARSLARAMGGDVLYRPRDRVDGLEGSVFTLVLPSLPRKEGS